MHSNGDPERLLRFDYHTDKTPPPPCPSSIRWTWGTRETRLITAINI